MKLESAFGGVRIGCDIGGTFTDIVLEAPDLTLYVNKTSTTPDNPARAVVEGISLLLAQTGIAPGDITEIVHGTTTASNTILQRVGAKTALLTTLGFRDVLEIARIRTPTMFDLTWKKPEPLAPRRWRREINERLAADGSVVTPITTDEVLRVAAELAGEGVEAIAIAFLHSYINPAHEILARDLLIRHFPSLRITASCDVLPEMKEYERTSTTVVNAYILPAMRSYLEQLKIDLATIGVTAPIQVMASNGGMMGIDAASRKPVFAVASGPAGGVTGAARLGALTGDPDLIVFDMGGTTAKASIVHEGEPSLTNEYEFRDGISAPSRFIKGGGYVLKVPAIDISEVGAGGGSVAAIDAGGLLLVGPESVGASPGPACYRLGSMRPTVTDANMVLGFLNPVALAGGSLKVYPELSAQAIADAIAGPLRLSVIEAAHGIRHVANVNMARAIRAVTVERGRDPRDMTMIAFGGGGPLHAVDVARLLGIRRVIAPVTAGVFSAVGMLAADAEHNFVRAVLQPLSTCDKARFAQHLRALSEQGLTALATEGYEAESVSLVTRADLRFIGQSSELTIDFTADFTAVGGVLEVEDVLLTRLDADFRRTYFKTFGYTTDEPVELVNLRVAARGVSARRLDFARIRIDAQALDGLSGSRPVSFTRGQSALETRLMARSLIGTDAQAGPLVIESYDTTIVVPPGCTARRDAVGNILIDIQY
jgi:N-methylhydantoinase A